VHLHRTQSEFVIMAITQLLYKQQNLLFFIETACKFTRCQNNWLLSK